MAGAQASAEINIMFNFLKKIIMCQETKPQSLNDSKTLNLTVMQFFYLRSIVYVHWLETKQDADKVLLQEIDKVLKPTSAQMAALNKLVDEINDKTLKESEN